MNDDSPLRADMTRGRKILVALTAIALLAGLAVALYLSFGDLGVLRGPVERFVSRALGRELRVHGRFELNVARAASLVAEDVELADPGRPQPMAKLGRVELELDLWSLLSGPARVRELVVRDARVRLEQGADGRANWAFDAPGSRDEPTEKRAGAGLAVRFDHARVEAVELTYMDPSRARPLAVRVDRLELETGRDDHVDVDGAGAVNGLPVDVDARLGPFANLFSAQPCAFDVSGHVGDAALSLSGKLESLVDLEGPDLTLDLQGPDLAKITEALSLPPLGEGSFALDGRLVSTGDGVEVSVDAKLGELRVELNGEVDRLLVPGRVELQVEGSGPDLATAAWLGGVRGLPAGPFTVSGTLHHDAARTAFERVELRVGANALAVDGVLGSWPDMIGTDLTLEASGPDLSAFDELVRARLPAGRFRLKGHLVRLAEGVAVKGLEAEIGGARAHVEGTIATAPRGVGTVLDVEAQGPRLAAFDPLAGIELADEPFAVTGRVKLLEDAVAVQSATARLGRKSASFDGTFGVMPGLVGTDLRVRAEGEEFTWLADLVRLSELGPEPFTASGQFRIRSDAYVLRAAQGTLGDVSLEFDGNIAARSDLFGSRARIRVAGPDLSRVASLAGWDAVPTRAFDVAGEVRVGTEGYELEKVRARVDDVALSVDGRIGRSPGFQGSEVELAVRGPDLSELSAFGDLGELPGGAFDLSARIGFDGTRYRLAPAVFQLLGNRLELDGLVDPATRLAGSELDFSLSGPDLERLGRLAAQAGLAEVPELPAEPYSFGGHLLVAEHGYELRSITAGVGAATIKLDGTVVAPSLVGTDVTIEAEGPNASILGPITRTELPAEPFRVDGRVERHASGARFHDLRATLGDSRLRVDGNLGEPPRLVGTRLDVRAEGPSLDLISRFVDTPRLPARPFEVSGRLEGTPERFTLEGFDARVGESDLSGSFTLDLRERPDLSGEFSSETLDLTVLIPQDSTEAVELDEAAREVQGEDPASSQTGHRSDLLIPDEPLRLERLQVADANVRCSVGRLVTALGGFHQVELGLQLDQGRLRLDPVSGVGELGGRLSGNVELDPAEPGYRLRARLTGDQLRFDFLGTGDNAKRPPARIELVFEGSGATPHQIVGSADGHALVVLGDGELPSSTAVELVGVDLLTQLFRTLNPFAKKDRNTRFECGVLSLELQAGRAVLKPVVARTEQITVVARGRIDFGSEKLDLAWASKPRKGIGLSASAITNSYVKLGGSLTNPSLELKPAEAVLATGAAVGTAGLSVAAKGLWDRLSAERKVCKRALREVERQESRSRSPEDP